MLQKKTGHTLYFRISDIIEPRYFNSNSYNCNFSVCIRADKLEWGLRLFQHSMLPWQKNALTMVGTYTGKCSLYLHLLCGCMNYPWAPILALVCGTASHYIRIHLLSVRNNFISYLTNICTTLPKSLQNINIFYYLLITVLK
jgi:hypothetical protein